MELPSFSTKVQKALVRVIHSKGNTGMGFRVGKYILTASHCIPSRSRFPYSQAVNGKVNPVNITSFNAQQRHKVFLAFIDPCADVAVLRNGMPCDEADQSLPDKFVEHVGDIALANTKTWQIPTNQLLWIPTHEGGWVRGVAPRLESFPMRIEIGELSGPILGGTSGAPILDDQGLVVGVLSESSDSDSVPPEYRTCSGGCILSSLSPYYLYRMNLKVGSQDLEKVFGIGRFEPPNKPLG